MLVEVGDEGANGGFLLCPDISAPEDGATCCLMTSHAVKPVLDLALNLPQQVVFVDFQWTVDDGFSDDIDGLEDGVRGFEVAAIEGAVEFVGVSS